MNVIRCKNGHFFDGDSYDKCPHCGESAMNAAGATYTPHEEPKKGLFGRKKNKEAAPPPVTPSYDPPRPMMHGGMYDNGDTPTDVIEKRVPSAAPSQTPERKQAPGGGHTIDFWDRPSTSDSRPITGSASVIRETKQEIEREPVVEKAPVEPAVPEKAPEPVRPEPVKEERREEPVKEPVKQSSLAEAVKNASASNEGKTMSYFSAATSAAAAPAAQTGSSPRQPSEPVVGWLVCIKGPHFGECFSIFAGKNSIGRSGENRIVIGNDNSISRIKHALIVYEPKKRNFYLQPGDSSGLTYLNDDYIDESHKLAQNDTLELGDSKFLFVPLCGESFTWEDHMPKGE